MLKPVIVCALALAGVVAAAALGSARPSPTELRIAEIARAAARSVGGRPAESVRYVKTTNVAYARALGGEQFARGYKVYVLEIKGHFHLVVGPNSEPIHGRYLTVLVTSAHFVGTQVACCADTPQQLSKVGPVHTIAPL